MHPLDLFKYCPRCGSSDFKVNDERSKRCEHCGFTYYHNASAATVAVILNSKNELLVARRAFNPAKGTLDLPGGFVDPGENIESGCLREIKEETGAEAEILRYLFSIPNTYCYSDFNVHTADSFFLCRLKDETVIQASDDAADLYWIPLEQVNAAAFGLNSVRQGVERLLPLLKSSNNL